MQRTALENAEKQVYAKLQRRYKPIVNLVSRASPSVKRRVWYYNTIREISRLGLVIINVIMGVYNSIPEA